MIMLSIFSCTPSFLRWTSQNFIVISTDFLSFPNSNSKNYGLSNSHTKWQSRVKKPRLGLASAQNCPIGPGRDVSLTLKKCKFWHSNSSCSYWCLQVDYFQDPLGLEISFNLDFSTKTGLPGPKRYKRITPLRREWQLGLTQIHF